MFTLLLKKLIGDNIQDVYLADPVHDHFYYLNPICSKEIVIVDF